MYSRKDVGMVKDKGLSGASAPVGRCRRLSSVGIALGCSPTQVFGLNEASTATDFPVAFSSEELLERARQVRAMAGVYTTARWGTQRVRALQE